MRTRRAAVVAASLGLLGGGAAWTMSPALAASPATIDDTVPDDESTTGGDETTTATEAEPSSDETSDDATADDQTGADGDLGDDQMSTTGDSWIDDLLADLVADGTLTQSQADAVAAAFEDAMPVLGGRGDVARPGRVGGIAIGLDVAADALGISTEELVTALGEDQSIADVAVSQGVEVQTVIDALVETASERIDEAVAAGELTEEQGAERLAIAIERVNELVNRPGGLPRPGRPGRPGTNWPGGFPGDEFPGFPGGGFPGQPNDDGAFPSLGGPGHEYGHDEWDGGDGPAPTDGPSSTDSSAADAGDSTDLDTADA
ncbi:hypothetical protein [Desertimonas flava]|uniref:hypothetical protein n=1 Tax=Desertimonas flava TaxID=2064846 RepID=UPI0013C46B68|nr:hypothetical protein [Desertimonas flava]